MFTVLFNNFGELSKFSELSEGWSFLNFKGTWKEENKLDAFHKINEYSKSSDFKLGLSWQLDGQAIEFNTFLEDLLNGSNWELNINKVSRLTLNKKTFFYSLQSFKDWSKTLDAFDSNNPLLSSFPIAIVVNGIDEVVIANNYIICPPSKIIEFKVIEEIPDFIEINSIVHIAKRENFIVEPKKLFITEGICTDTTTPFFEMAVKSLAVCLVSEIGNQELVILRGIRKIELPLFKNITVLNVEVLCELKNSVKWIYDEKIDLKIKLFLDRFTLDVDLKKDYISELIRLNKNCLEQAKERFSFITFERKDQFQKELRDLLKDLKIVSDLYSTKARGLLSNLLRDVLAGLLLIGITILSKVENINSVAQNPLINLIFKAFAIYFILSILYQSIFDFVDIIKTKNEFIYWKQTSREYISEADFKVYLQQTVGKREVFTFVYYCFLIITYLLLAYLSYNFTQFLEFAVKKGM